MVLLCCTPLQDQTYEPVRIIRLCIVIIAVHTPFLCNTKLYTYEHKQIKTSHTQARVTRVRRTLIWHDYVACLLPYTSYTYISMFSFLLSFYTNLTRVYSYRKGVITTYTTTSLLYIYTRYGHTASTCTCVVLHQDGEYVLRFSFVC